MTCPLIAEHRLIGDLQTAALVTTGDPCGRHVDVHVPRIGSAPEPVKPANV
jgi:hypothetical protein